MKLDMDLLRQIMLFLETQDYFIENPDGSIENEPVWFETLCEHFSDTGKQQIFYSLQNLHQAEYIILQASWADDTMQNCCVSTITFKGHEFIASVCDDKNWKRIKKGLLAVRNYSLSAINAIAEGVTSAAISAFLNPPSHP